MFELDAVAVAAASAALAGLAALGREPLARWRLRAGAAGKALGDNGDAPAKTGGLKR